MSVSANISVNLAKKIDTNIYSAIEIIKNMLNNGWRVIHKNKIFYLPVGDIGDFIWQSEKIDENEFLELVKEKEIAHEIIGVSMYWKDSDIGFSLIIFETYDLSFNIMINRIRIDLSNKYDVTDVSWYLERILPCIETDKLTITRITFTQD